ncbi:helix-turn-helix domain-containing protein [Mucilaginibacter lutimaris]|uniref:Helix-turn-helix domain-containing protein n=1 Tax=Mucilaginibacter lutimaris TaxID=931629 RepID=A0ABW2ZGW8_9SPHI
MNVDLVTSEDLQQFKNDLLKEIGDMMGQPPGKEKQWIKGCDVRKLLGISNGTLQNLRLNGTLPFTKIGGTMYYRNSVIQNLLEGKV